MTTQIVSPKEGNLPRRSSVVQVQDGKGNTRTVNFDDLSQADRALAEQFGYKPVFKRQFGYLSTFSFAVSISGLFATIATTFVYPLEAGGASAIVWCWLISGAGCMCIAASVAELVSAYPTCGGLYYTISRLAPREWVASVSWVDGWLNLLGQVAGVASSEYGSAQILLAAVSLGSGGTYYPTAGHTVGVMAALTVLCGLLNSLSTYWMEKMTKTYVIFHVLVLLSAAIALLVLAPDIDVPEWKEHSAKYVFTDVYNDSGWAPNGFSWLFGFLSVSWTMTDYDATAHITEEINQPEIKAPWAIFLAMLFTYIGGFLFNIVLVFVMGDPAQLLDYENYNLIEQPVVLIFQQVLGTKGAIAFAIFALIILQFVCFTAMQALARTVFAFSRDRLIPASKVWTKINQHTNTPLYAVWISVFWCIVINLIGLGSYIAISGVFNITAICLDWSYCIPILCKVLFGKFEPGPWHMGKIGWFVNIYACIWTLFVSIIFILPTIRPVTPQNMNYAIVYLGGILATSTIFWYAGGKKYYTGPLVEADVLVGEEDSTTGSNDAKKEISA
ncbi:amino acid permease [Xylariaceae sp. FL0255]|nr:amino acid permease [Xylariaceae sp. FL0255]